MVISGLGYQWGLCDGGPTARLQSIVSYPCRATSSGIHSHFLHSEYKTSLDRHVKQRVIKSRLGRCLSARRYVAVAVQGISQLGLINSQRKFCRHLSLSLFTKVANIPPDGSTLTPEEESCDPYFSNCRTPVHVWETKCSECNGSGTVYSCVRGRLRTSRNLASCPLCSGIGYVRYISSHFDNSTDSILTLNRTRPRSKH